MTVLIGTLTLTIIGGLCAALLNYATRYFKTNSEAIIELINTRLPQTQCAQCGYPGCRPYAEAISKGDPINKCPPGGTALIQELADLLGREQVPLDTSYGESLPPRVAVIREAECIGCTLCAIACPVDAIIGAPQMMHSVISRDCTGCDLCLEPCPVDCIDMIVVETVEVRPLRLPRIDQDALDLIQYDCIHCGLCEPSCPRELAPQALFWHRTEPERLQSLNLADCIECRLCDRVCPSNIPLTASFQAAKQRQYELDQSRAKAREAQARFQRGQRRVTRVQAKVRARPNKQDRLSMIDRLRNQKS